MIDRLDQEIVNPLFIEQYLKHVVDLLESAASAAR
jgi:hypothetical protein